MSEICSKSTTKTEQRHSCRSSVFNVNFEQIRPLFYVSFVDFEQVNIG